MIPDNMRTIVAEAENCAPGLTTCSLSTPSRGASSSTPHASATDRQASGRADRAIRAAELLRRRGLRRPRRWRRRAALWCAETAGMRVHGTTCCRPAEVFRAEELALLLPAPAGPFDTPRWSKPKVARDFHVEVDRALYCLPHQLVGRHLKARRDQQTVKLYFRRRAREAPPPQAPGKRSPTRPTCRPARRSTPRATSTGCASGRGGRGDRQLRRGPARRAAAVDQDAPGLPALRTGEEVGRRARRAGLSRALDAEAVDVNLVGRMLERAKEADGPARPATRRRPGALCP